MALDEHRLLRIFDGLGLAVLERSTSARILTRLVDPKREIRDKEISTRKSKTNSMAATKNENERPFVPSPWGFSDRPKQMLRETPR